MDTPQTVGECVEQIFADAKTMDPYYQEKGEADDGTLAFLERELAQARWTGLDPRYMGIGSSGLEPLEFLERGFTTEAYSRTETDAWIDRDLLQGFNTQIQAVLTRYARLKRALPPYVQTTEMLLQLLGQRERHEEALPQGYQYYSGAWLCNECLPKYPWERKASELNIWHSAVQGVDRRTGTLITNGRVHDGGDSIREACFVNSPTRAYVHPILTFTTMGAGRKTPRDMRDWLFRFDPLPEGQR